MFATVSAVATITLGASTEAVAAGTIALAWTARLVGTINAGAEHGFVDAVVFGTGSGLVGMIVDDGDRFANEAFDTTEEVTLAAVAEGDGLSIESGAGGAADAVDVGFGFLGEVVVEDEGDALDVDTACGDVGGDEDAATARAEVEECAFAGTLGFVAVDGFSLDAVTAKLLDELVGHVLHADEDEDEADGVGVNEVDEGLGLLAAIDEGDMLVDAFGGGGDGSDFHAGGIAHDGGGEVLDRRRHGRGEEERLAVGGELGDDALDVGDETEIEHAVGFVEDEDFDFIETDAFLFFEIHQAAGSGDEDIDAARELADLRSDVDAAEDGEVGELQVLAVVGEALADLGGEFAGGGEDQGAGALGHGRRRMRGEALQDGEREGGGLASAGLGDADEITALKEERDRFGLDGRGDGVVLGFERAQKGFGEGEVLEEDGGFGGGGAGRGYNGRALSCHMLSRNWSVHADDDASARSRNLY